MLVPPGHWLLFNFISPHSPSQVLPSTKRSPERTSNGPNLPHFWAFAFGCSRRCFVPKSLCAQLITYCNSGFTLKVTSLERSSLTTNAIQRNFPLPHQVFSSEDVSQLKFSGSALQDMHMHAHTCTHMRTHTCHSLVNVHLSTTIPKTQKSAETKEHSNVFQWLNERMISWLAANCVTTGKTFNLSGL